MRLSATRQVTGAVGAAALRVWTERAAADFVGFEGLSILGRCERKGLRGQGAAKRAPEPGPLRFLVPACDLEGPSSSLSLDFPRVQRGVLRGVERVDVVGTSSPFIKCQLPHTRWLYEHTPGFWEVASSKPHA